MKYPPEVKNGTVLVLAGNRMRVVNWVWHATGLSRIDLVAEGTPDPTATTATDIKTATLDDLQRRIASLHMEGDDAAAHNYNLALDLVSRRIEEARR